MPLPYITFICTCGWRGGAMISIDFSIVVCETCALHKLWTNMWLQEVSYTALCLCPVFFFYSGVVTLTPAHTHTHTHVDGSFLCLYHTFISFYIFCVHLSYAITILAVFTLSKSLPSEMTGKRNDTGQESPKDRWDLHFNQCSAVYCQVRM